MVFFIKVSKTKSREFRKRFLPIRRIAKINTSDLPIKHNPDEPPWHYVYIREYDKNKKLYHINVCTHLDKYDKREKKYKVNEKHLNQVKKGNTYPIPRFSAGFPSWTGIKKDVYIIPKGVMYDFNCVRLKKTITKETIDNF